MKRIPIVLLAAVLLLSAACQPTPDHEIVVQKDTDRLIETVIGQQDADTVILPASEQTHEPIQPVTERYTYSYTSENKRLTIRVDADVSVPESGKIPMARVKAVGLSDAFAKNAFDYIYQGNPVYVRGEGGMKTKAQFAEEIAYYQELIETGRTAEAEMDEQGAQEEIDYLMELYEKAPVEAVPVEQIPTDGTPMISENDGLFGKQTDHRLEIYDDIGYYCFLRRELQDGTVTDSSFNYLKGPTDNAIGYMESQDSREFQNWYSDPVKYCVMSSETACEHEQKLSPADAVKIALDFLSDLGIEGVEPFRTCDLYVAKTKNGVKSLYVLDFVKVINGCSVAYVPLFQTGYGYSEHELPWKYEMMRVFVNGDGTVLSASWRDPIEVTKVLSDDVRVMSFESAKKHFEVLCKSVYEPRTEAYERLWYVDLTVDHIELSLLRIREQNADQKVGLYVPAWVFYGIDYEGYSPSETVDKSTYLTSVIFAINAIDGSIIDLEKGY